MFMEFSAQQIAMLLGGKVTGDANRKVWDVGSIENAKEGQLTFLCDAKYLPHLPQTGASVVLMTDSIAFDGETNATLIRVENARAAMGQLLSLVAKAMNPAKQGIEQPSYISEGVTIPEDAYIGAFAYIGKNVQLGKGVQIYPHTYIGDNVRIGDNTILYSGVKVYYNCVIGKDCILHAGVVIGSDGFGFEPDAKGVNQKLPQIGNVTIEVVESCGIEPKGILPHELYQYEEIAQRKAAFSWTFPKNDYPRYLNLFVKNVGSMAKGGIWER